MSNTNTTSTDSKGEKAGFFTRMFNKIDTVMKEKAEKQEGCCCCESGEGKETESCCESEKDQKAGGKCC